MNVRYYWTPASGTPIDEYLKKTKPTMVTDTDTPWIFVGTDKKEIDPERSDAANVSQTGAITAGSIVLDKLVNEMARIEKDDSIPVRAKKGQKSKKAVREEAQAEAVVALKEVSIKHGYAQGKWMLFPGPDNVDRVWGQVARSIAHGPLRDAGVYTAKVAPTSTGGEEQRSYLICIYFNDVYDEALVRKIMTILLTEHGLESNSVKSNLYTLLGIDSNHPSKLRSTIWRPNEVIPVDEIKSLKEQYSSAKEAASNKAAASAPAPVSAPEPAAKSDEAGVGASAGKGAAGEPKVKRKEPADSTNTHKEEDKPMKRVKSAALAFKENDMFAGSDEHDD